MSNKHLVTVILPAFIKVLQAYESTYRPILATLTLNTLSNTKHTRARILLDRLQKLAENGDVSVFNDTNITLLELVRSESRQSNLTMPSRGTLTSDWAATPMPRPVLLSPPTALASDEDWAPSTPVLGADDESAADAADSLLVLSNVLACERQNIHKARAGYKTGSLDGILYAMSRSLYFIKWFYSEINIPVDSPDENIEDIQPNQRYCLQLIWLIASYMCHYSFDRACKRWDHHHIHILKSPNYYALDNKYYLNSGMVSFPKVTQDDMVKLDGYGNTMVNCLSILSDIYLEVETDVQLSSLDFVTTVMLDSKFMPTEYMNKIFLAKIVDIKNQLNVLHGPNSVIAPLLDKSLFDSRADEDITIEENRLDRIEAMSPTKMVRTHKPSIDS